MNQENHISYFLKYIRRKNKLTQEDLALKAGVGLRFIRDLEQGKESLRLDKVNQVLSLFGYRVMPGDDRGKDQWNIIMNYMNRNVHVYLKDKSVLAGFLLDYKMVDQQVVSWKFVSNNDAIKYRETKDELLTRQISSDEMLNVETI
jgi:y4mF family transcriptional regulator